MFCLQIPTFEGEVRSPVKDKTGHASPGSVKSKSRSNSKSSKSSFHDGLVQYINTNTQNFKPIFSA